MHVAIANACCLPSFALVEGRGEIVAAAVCHVRLPGGKAPRRCG
eukprot:COSAG01_NODE_64748_length_275_cov_0.920455_1_plen_43_part_10